MERECVCRALARSGLGTYPVIVLDCFWDERVYEQGELLLCWSHGGATVAAGVLSFALMLLVGLVLLVEVLRMLEWLTVTGL